MDMTFLSINCHMHKPAHTYEIHGQSVGLQVQIASGCHSFISLTAKKHWVELLYTSTPTRINLAVLPMPPPPPSQH